MARILFRNCRVWDGSGAAAYPADVLVEDEPIRAVARERGQFEALGAEVIEAGGMTLMPGLVEGRAHITFINGARPTDLGDTPPEEHTLIARATRGCCWTTASPASTPPRPPSFASMW